jgi:FkbM family methyltransferase
LDHLTVEHIVMPREAIAQLGFAALRAKLAIPRVPFIRSFLQKQYLRDLLQRLRINCFLDVGANRGQYARQLRRMGYTGHILSFEPSHSEFLAAVDLAGNDPLWKPFELALGSENTSRPLNVIEGATVFSSFLKPIHDNASKYDFPEEARVTAEVVQVRRLDSLLDALLKDIVAPRVFLKIDTQGYDMEVVKGAAGCILWIVGLQSELSVTPIYKDMPHYTDALAYYESLGLSLMDLFIVSRAKDGSVLEYDCLMARSDQLEV